MSTLDPDRGLITIAAALRVEAVRRGDPVVVAGHAHLDRPIRWVHDGDVPRIATLLKGHELLLTTGMGIGPRSADQRRFIAELGACDVAGIMIEVGTIFDELPPALVEAAGSSQLPLIALRTEVPFVDITEAVHREIVNRQFLLMRRAAALHRQFFSLVLEGAGISEVLSALSATIANPVVLLGPGDRVLFRTLHHGRDPFERGVPCPEPAISLPLALGGQQPGRLVAVGATSPLTEFDRIALERAASVIALIVLRQRDVDVELERSSIFGQLLDRDVAEPAATALATSLGLPARPGPRLAVVASLAWDDEPAATWAPAVALVRRKRRWRAIVGTREHGQVLLLAIALDGAEARRATADEVADLLREAAARRVGAREPPLVCVGDVATSWATLARAFEHLLEHLPQAAQAPPARWHDATQPRLDGLLWAIRDEPELGTFVHAQLEPLIEHDRVHGSELLATVAALCEHGGRKAETARALGLERQTLYRRIKTIEDLLGSELASERTWLGLHLAVHARPHLDEGQAGERPGARRV